MTHFSTSAQRPVWLVGNKGVFFASAISQIDFMLELLMEDI